jgi:hypothetical protein
LPAVDADALVAGIEAVSALKVIDVAFIGEVNAIDKELQYAPHMALMKSRSCFISAKNSTKS